MASHGRIKEMNQFVDVRQVFDCVSEIWVLVDKNGKVLLTGKHLQRFQHMFGTPVLEGASLLDSIPKDWHRLAENVLNTLQDSRIPSVLEASYTDPAQRETHFEIKCTGLRGDDGVLQQIFIEARDVTPQK